MYAGRDYDPSDVGESELYGFDFVEDLPVGDTITSVAFTMTVESGVDPDPAARLDGLPGIFETQVFQRVSGMLADVTYTFQAKVLTAQGNILSLFSHIPSRTTF